MRDLRHDRVPVRDKVAFLSSNRLSAQPVRWRATHGAHQNGQRHLPGVLGYLPRRPQSSVRTMGRAQVQEQQEAMQKDVQGGHVR